MVDRGNCSFQRKMRNGQTVGAAAVLIANIAHAYENGLPLFAGDGNPAHDLVTPSFILEEQLSNQIRSKLLGGGRVVFNFAWGLRPIDGVTYDLWTTPLDRFPPGFISNWTIVEEAFQNRTSMVPYMFLFDGSKFGCTDDGAPSDFCDGYCTNHGRYCFSPTYPADTTTIPGLAVVKESLRRLCIFDHYSRRISNVGWGYWNRYFWTYTRLFDELCRETNFTNETCIDRVYEMSSIFKRDIDECMSMSDLDANATVNMLELQLAAQQDRLFAPTPSVNVNNEPTPLTNLTVYRMFAAICNGFAECAVPRICHRCLDCDENDMVECVQNGGDFNCTNVATISLPLPVPDYCNDPTTTTPSPSLSLDLTTTTPSPGLSFDPTTGTPKPGLSVGAAPECPGVTSDADAIVFDRHYAMSFVWGVLLWCLAL